MPQQANDGGDSDANFHRQYDRQIRLWGLDAQKRMTGNASAVARRVRVARSRCTDSVCACTKVHMSWCVACAAWQPRFARILCLPVSCSTCKLLAHRLPALVDLSPPVARPEALFTHKPSMLGCMA